MRLVKVGLAVLCVTGALASTADAVTITSGQNTFGALTTGVSTSLSALAAPVANQPLYPARTDGQMPAGLDISVALASNVPAGITPSDLAAVIKNANMDFARMTVPWADVENTMNSWAFATYDAEYVALVNAGIRPVLQVLWSPSWAIGYTSKVLGIETKDNGCTGTWCMEPPSPANYTYFGRFVAQLAKRYPLAAGIEIWNEPNLWGFWHAYNTDPAAYTALLGAAYDAVKNPTTGNPAMRVLGGAINNFTGHAHPASWACQPPTTPNSFQISDCNAKWDMSIGDFLDGMLTAGAAAKMDGLSFHAYPLDASYTGFSSTTPVTGGSWYYGAYPTIDKVLSSHGLLGSVRLVNSEVGATTTSPFSLSLQDTAMTDLYTDMNAGVPTSPTSSTATTDAALFFMPFDISGQPFGWLDSTKLAAPNAAYYTPRAVYCDMSTTLNAPTAPPGC